LVRQRRSASAQVEEFFGRGQSESDVLESGVRKVGEPVGCGGLHWIQHRGTETQRNFGD